jgi:hypothetical protein
MTLQEEVQSNAAGMSAVSEQTAAQMGQKREGGHPLFSAVQSVILGRKYGINPLVYHQNPGLRTLDTRQAALEGLQSVGSSVKRWRAGNAPTVPSPTPQPAAQPKTPPPSNWIG